MPKVPSAHTEASLVPQNSNRIYNEFGRLANPNHLKSSPDLTPSPLTSPLSINGEGGIDARRGGRLTSPPAYRPPPLHKWRGGIDGDLFFHDFCSEDAFRRFVGDELGVVADRTAESDFF